VPCYNYPSVAASRRSAIYELPNTAVSSTLRSTLSSRLTKADSSFSSRMSPLWSWWGVGAKKAHGARPTDYYGFSLLPSGGILGDSKFSQVGTAAELALASNERLQLHYANQNTYTSVATASSVRCVHIPELDGTVDKNKYMITLSTNLPNKTTVSPSGEKFGSLPTTVKTATTNDTLRFDGWFEGETMVHSTPNYPFVVTGPRTLEARYTYIGQMITLSTNYPYKVTVDPSGDRIEGTSVTIKTATTNDTLRFDGWFENGTLVHSTSSYPFVVIGPRTLEARYTYIGQKITITANRTSQVNKTASYFEIPGKQTTVTTSASNSMLVFDGWYEGNTKVYSSQTYPFTVAGPRTLEARYNIDGAEGHCIPDVNFRNYITGTLGINIVHDTET
ncbi:MAG: InlB B-repeat-containing protein, partial [Phocaeicola sp.]